MKLVETETTDGWVAVKEFTVRKPWARPFVQILSPLALEGIKLRKGDRLVQHVQPGNPDEILIRVKRKTRNVETRAVEGAVA
jgi:hypothetical protein